MLKIEEYLLNSKTTIADETYVSDGIIAVHKDFLKNKVLKHYTYIPDKDFEHIKEKGILCNVEYAMGEEFELPVNCILDFDNRILIPYDDEFSFNYDYVKLFFDSFDDCWRDLVTYVANFDNGKVLKFFYQTYIDEIDEYEYTFVGLITAIS